MKKKKRKNNERSRKRKREKSKVPDLKIALVYSVTDTMHIYTHRAIYKNLLIFMWRSAEKESERRSESGRRERERAPKAAQEMASVKVKERKLETSLHRIEWNCFLGKIHHPYALLSSYIYPYTLLWTGGLGFLFFFFFFFLSFWILSFDQRSVTFVECR